MRVSILLLASGFAACGEGPASFGDNLDDPQLPARGADDMATWIASGFYENWHCESEPHPARSPSPHGRNRICNNDALQAAKSGDGPWPVGAASVKEIFGSSSTIVNYAVYRKLEAGAGGDTWYWYEGHGDDVS